VADNKTTVPENPSDTQFLEQEEAAAVLREAQNQYQQLIDGLPDGYAEFDLKGNLIGFNEALMAMYSRTKDELMNLSYKAFMDQKTVARVRQEYEGVCQTGLPKQGRAYEVIGKDGRKTVVEGSVTLKKANGKVVGFRGFWRDITERRRAERELARHRSRLEAIFASVKEGVIALDGDGLVINANHAVETICGVPVGTLVGRPFTEYQGLCGRSCRLVLQEALSGGMSVKECRIGCNRYGRPQQVVVFNTSPLMDQEGRSMGAVLVMRDITELLGLEKELRGRYQFQNLIGKSKKMQEIYDLLENLASLETTVLITGESGTGKELVARALHYSGARAPRPFIRVNCSALTESLLESELFGHVKGAFTGAIKDRQGRFQAADGGTILLDEIGDISPIIQLKLLRVLQEKEFERVGESASCRVDVRVITSTNRDLKEKVKKGEFRQDLYYRLKVMDVVLPALRDRREDIPLLAAHFCRLFRERLKKGIEGISSEVLNRFRNYPWPGNVRELEHGLEHAFVVCTGRTIELEHLPREIRAFTEMKHAPAHARLRPKLLAAHEVRQALEASRGNKSKAALMLGIDRSTIYRKIKQYSLLDD
jgi:two-component system, NtrC family, response regulator HydG